MPSIVGSINTVSMDHGAVVNLNESVILSPKSTSKTFAGAGSFNTGDFPHTNNDFSTTNTYDPDIADANAMGSL